MNYIKRLYKTFGFILSAGFTLIFLFGATQTALNADITNTLLNLLISFIFLNLATILKK